MAMAGITSSIQRYSPAGIAKIPPDKTGGGVLLPLPTPHNNDSELSELAIRLAIVGDKVATAVKRFTS